MFSSIQTHENTVRKKSSCLRSFVEKVKNVWVLTAHQIKKFQIIQMVESIDFVVQRGLMLVAIISHFSENSPIYYKEWAKYI